tara:strand:+ start:3048 stop:4220 length:1173 start_codon:yes stop_codon:yes gene_type:complete
MMRTKDMKGLMEAISSVMTPQVAIDEARQMKDPKKDSMVSKGGKTIVIDKSKEKEYLAKGWTLSEKKKLDPVDDKANDKEFKDRKDKDIDNDGDVDSSDEFLHKKRAATDDAIDGGDKPAKPKKGVNPFKKEDVDLEEGKVKSKMIDDSEKMSKKDFIKKYGKQNAKDLYEDDEEAFTKGKTKKPFPPEKDGEEQDSEDESEDEVKDPKVAGKKDDKKKVASNAKTAEISKIGEGYTTNEEIRGLADAITELHNMWESAAKKSVKGATDKGEEMDSKDSPKSKEFTAVHKKSDKKIEDNEEDGHDVTFKAQGGTKASSGKRSIDNGNGDNKIVKSTVAEDADNVIAQAQNIIDGKTMSEIAAMEEPKSKNPHDARTREARSFLQRMAKRG